MTEMPTALAIVIGAILALRGLIGLGRRGRAPGRRLRLVETCALGPRARLHVVEVDGERLLVSASEGGVTLLRSLPAGEADASAEEGDAGERPLPLSQRGLPLRLGSFLRGWVPRLGVVAVFVLLSSLHADPAAAQAAPSEAVAGALSSVLDIDGATRPDRIANTLEIVALMTLISIAPSLLLMGTCFTRVVIVLSLLRQAIGVHQLPPNQVLVGLALFVTMSVMAPVGQQMHDQAFEPYVERQIDAATALERGIAPVREFLLVHTREKDVSLFLSFSSAAEEGGPADPSALPMSVLLPSYMLSELRTAFEIGFMVFLPFLVIDLVIASVLISMGMIVLPPIVVSLPFKLMLFVLVDGWNLVIGSLVRGLI
ncbi:MAG: flagellar type III secretion system pore protein FliP [Myxococcota bacterium]